MPRPPPFRAHNFKFNHHSNGGINKLTALFPACQAVFLPDNASNHSYAPDALRVENMNLNPGGKQSILREAFMHRKGRPQSMSFPPDYHSLELAGKPKEIKRVLKERGLCPERSLMLECPTTRNRPSCNSEGISVLAEFLRQSDFQDQKGRLQGEACRSTGSSSSVLPEIPL